MTKWEYLRVSHSTLLNTYTVTPMGTNPETHTAFETPVENTIKRLGNQGWELVSHSVADGLESYMFKRPKTS